MIAIARSIEYEYHCTEYRFAEYEYESAFGRERSKLRCRILDGKIVVGVNDPNGLDCYAPLESQNHEMHGSNGRRVWPVVTGLPLPRDFNRSPTE